MLSLSFICTTGYFDAAPGALVPASDASPGDGPVGALLAEVVGQSVSGTAQLRQDLDRFTFLLGADDGESLSGPDLAG